MASTWVSQSMCFCLVRKSQTVVMAFIRDSDQAALCRFCNCEVLPLHREAWRQHVSTSL